MNRILWLERGGVTQLRCAQHAATQAAAVVVFLNMFLDMSCTTTHRHAGQRNWWPGARAQWSSEFGCAMVGLSSLTDLQ